MSNQDPKEKQAISEVRNIFQRVRATLKINKHQSSQAVIFDMLSAVNNASVLLNEAWKLSELYNINDDWMRKEFVNMFRYFGKIKKDINKEIKYKH